jgi:hypothetical protein
MKTKLCTLCAKQLPATTEYFYWNSRDLCFQSGCKSCRSAKAKGTAFNNRSLVLAAREERKQSTREDLLRRGVKICSVCGEEKVLDLFSKSPTCVLGRTNKCRECDAKNQRAYVSQPERVALTWRRKLWYGTKHTAKQKSYVFTLTEADISSMFERQQGRCYWFNVPLVPTHEHKHPQKPSIDRLDVTKGYTPDNVVLCCYTANIGRNTSSVETFRAFVEVLRLSLSTLPPVPT